MPTVSAVFVESLGWLIALMLAALLPGLAAMRRWNHTGWLAAFCATRLLIEAQGLVGPAWSGETRELAAILSGTLLWEFARGVWNDSQPRRRISAATHVVAVECFAVIFAANAGAGWTATLGWLLPVAVLVATLPILLGGASVLLLWRCFDRPALRIAAIGLGLYGLGAAAGPVALIGAISPWLVAGGLAKICFAVPATRTRAALICVAGLFATFAAGPLFIAASLRQIDRDEPADLLARAQAAIAPLQGRNATRLEADFATTDGARLALRDHVAALRTADPLLRDATVWKLRGNRILTLDLQEKDAGTFVDRRPATADEIESAIGLRPFITRTAGRVVVHGPLKTSSLDTPLAWLALDYPEAVWDLQRDRARNNGVALIAVLAGFCAVGFVLAGRQALENAQRLEIERVQAADKAKTEFLAFLGHELRTPLQTILGRAEMLQRQPAASRHATEIETQGRLLLRLVTDLLDLGTIEAGRFELRAKPFSLRGLVAGIEESVRPIAEGAGLAFSSTIDAAVPDTLEGDEFRLRQILGNLLGNAVKYTPRGRVSLEVAIDANEPTKSGSIGLVFRVRDTGPGLPPDKIPQLFTLFTRLDSGETFTREGTGVGLALVRRLCSLMDGTVSAANYPTGGAEFTVRLTLPLAAPRETASLTKHAPSARNPLAILLAEDNTAARELLAEALTAAGHTVVAVSDGEAALAAAKRSAFDIAVLDINLPRRDGVAVARELRMQHPNLRLIGCTAEALPAVRATALAAGMHELLVKPVGLDALLRAVEAPALVIPDASVFGRLRASPDSIARIRALLCSEWPRLWATAESAHSAGNRDAFKKCAHYLQSSALLLGDEALADLCGRLSALESSEENESRVLFAEFEKYFAPWRPKFDFSEAEPVASNGLS